MKSTKSIKQISNRPATTQEGRENQLIAAAYNLAEQRILNGTASAQEIVHFLKMGSPKSKLEEEKLQGEVELLTAKKEAIQSAKVSEKLYAEALNAMRTYSGHPEEDQYENLFEFNEY